MQRIIFYTHGPMEYDHDKGRSVRTLSRKLDPIGQLDPWLYPNHIWLELVFFSAPCRAVLHVPEFGEHLATN